MGFVSLFRFQRVLPSVLLLLLLLGADVAYTQEQKDNLGREFFIAFGPNTGGEQPDQEQSNEIELYITSKVATSGRVEIPALNFDRTFNTTPGQITTIVLPDGNNGTETTIVNQSEEVVSGMAVHVTAQDEIAVFGLNHKLFSTDAFMALPVDVLGTEYRAMAYPVSAVGQGSGRRIPGQFLVVAVEDGTNVTIVPRSETKQGQDAGTPINIVMNRGDVYLVQSATRLNSDLTGSLIESDRAIAVISGHERTEIPAGVELFNGNSPSRDHLVEQMPPVSAWGDSAFVIPFATSEKPDLVRIISAEDNNTISVNGVVVATLNAGDFYEITALNGVAQIQGTNPILVGQYLHTSWGELDNPDHPAYGDPDLALVFPVEQYTTSYTIVSIENEQAFTDNFVNIVVDASGIPSMRLDGNAIPPSEFKPIVGTTYVYAQIRVSQGTHNLTGEKPFGVTVYALGGVDSYAYTGGTLTKTITPLKSTDLIIDFGDRVLQPDLTGYFDTTVVLRNTSTEVVNVFGFPTRTQDVTKFRVIAPGVPYAIGPAQTDSMTIRFEPLEVNRRMHTQIMAKTDHLRAYVVDVYGRGVIDAPTSTSDSALRLPIQEIDFGYFARTDNPYDSAAYIGNLGFAEMQVTEITIVGLNQADFSIVDIVGVEGSLIVPFKVAKAPSGGTRVELRFTPGGADGLREAMLTYKTKSGLAGQIRLIAHILTIEMPTVQSAGFSETPLCKPGRQTIQITNPNSVPMRIDSIVFRGANPFDFIVDHQVPFEIPPRSNVDLPIIFTPEDVGPRTAQAFIYFNMPKGLWRTSTLTGSGMKYLLDYHVPKNIHILTGEEFRLPIYADVDLATFEAKGYILHLRYDPTHLEDIDVEVDNTLSADASIEFGGDWGERILKVKMWGGANLQGGGPDESRPLIVVKFRSFLAEGEDRIDFQEDVPIHYSLQLQDKQIEDFCIAQRVRTGVIALDSTCAEIHLVIPRQATTPTLDPNSPNPFNPSTVLPFTVPGDLPVKLEVLNEFGFVVKTLIDGPTGPGAHKITFNASELSSGVYVARMTYAGRVNMRRMVLVK